MTLRSFIYVDDYKIFSLSSQLFEGFTEHIVKTSEAGKTVAEQQKGMLGSGQTLADIASERTQTSEKQFLHDHAYTLFEERLLQDSLLYDIDNLHDATNVARKGSLVRVTARAVLLDYLVLRGMLENVNELAASAQFVESFEKFKLEKLSDSLGSSHHRGQGAKGKVSIQAIEKELLNRIREEQPVSDEFAKRLGRLVDYGFGSSLELLLTIGGKDGEQVKVSAILNRKYLREAADVIERKYARETTEKLTVAGIIAQAGDRVGGRKRASGSAGMPAEHASVKEVVQQLVMSMTTVEGIFRGVTGDALVLDVIAVYHELKGVKEDGE